MLELADVVRDLRAELYAAIEKGMGEPLYFELGEITLELSVAVTRKGGGGAKVRFWVVELGGDAEVGSASTQKITLKLSPRDAATGRAPHVAGGTEAGEGTGPAPPARG